MNVEAPLPERLRPQRLAEVLGQAHLLGPEGLLTRLMAAGTLPSLVLWGPPGCGKTTLARLLAVELGWDFAPFSAVLGGLAELRKTLATAAAARQEGRRTLLFIDELHRFSKTQQDALLPHIEDGTATLVGATTENPSFAITGALASRCRILALQPLGRDDGDALLARAAALLPGFEASEDGREALHRLACGDGRRLLLLAEQAWALAGPGGLVTAALVLQADAGRPPGTDRSGDSHYDLASAFIKSMRASDVQAALFWLARQIEAGEDPRFVARRVLIFASEDVGLADPQALMVAQAAFAAVEALGLPEAVYPLSQAVIHCATSPKSNSTKAYFAAAAAVRAHPDARVPLFLRNAPTALAREQGHGQGYRYDHDYPAHFAGQRCLPEGLQGLVFYQPGPFGYEKEIRRRMEWWESHRDPPSGGSAP